MKAVLVTVAALVAQQRIADAFMAPSLARTPACSSRHALHMSDSYKVSDKEGEVYRASEIAEENKSNKFQQEFSDKGVPQTRETAVKGDGKSGPVDYYGLIDGDSFDGGDGQVGCVGDGNTALDKFDTRAVAEAKKVKGEVMVKQSKDRQMNSFGSFSGYAEELEKSGMKKMVNGEDMLAVRRQQLENWRNQQELQKAQRARIAQQDAITGSEFSTGWKRGSRGYMEGISSGGAVPQKAEAWNTFQPKAADSKSDGTSWSNVKLSGKEKVTATIQCISENGRPGWTTIQVKNTVMTFEPFHCEFVGDDIRNFAVEPKTGTLNRRNGDPVPISVSFKADGPGDAKDALLVIETEEDKFVYQVEGRSA